MKIKNVFDRVEIKKKEGDVDNYKELEKKLKCINLFSNVNICNRLREEDLETYNKDVLFEKLKGWIGYKELIKRIVSRKKVPEKPKSSKKVLKVTQKFMPKINASDTKMMEKYLKKQSQKKESKNTNIEESVEHLKNYHKYVSPQTVINFYKDFVNNCYTEPSKITLRTRTESDEMSIDNNNNLKKRNKEMKIMDTERVNEEGLSHLITKKYKSMKTLTHIDTHNNENKGESAQDEKDKIFLTQTLKSKILSSKSNINIMSTNSTNFTTKINSLTSPNFFLDSNKKTQAIKLMKNNYNIPKLRNNIKIESKHHPNEMDIHETTKTDSYRINKRMEIVMKNFDKKQRVEKLREELDQIRVIDDNEVKETTLNFGTFIRSSYKPTIKANENEKLSIIKSKYMTDYSENLNTEAYLLLKQHNFKKY